MKRGLIFFGIALMLLGTKKGIDENLAREGEKLFKSKGCVACHTIGKGKLVGPDLKGITAKRKYAWLIAIITNPDSMLKYDSIAKSLREEYGVDMPNQNVSVKEAKAIIEYLKKSEE